MSPRDFIDGKRDSRAVIWRGRTQGLLLRSTKFVKTRTENCINSPHRDRAAQFAKPNLELPGTVLCDSTARFDLFGNV
jgi:hypothetical protein